MNYSNLLTAAFNYDTEAESREQGETERDRDGMVVWGFKRKKYKYRDFKSGGGREGGLKTGRSAKPE